MEPRFKMRTGVERSRRHVLAVLENDAPEGYRMVSLEFKDDLKGVEEWAVQVVQYHAVFERIDL